MYSTILIFASAGPLERASSVLCSRKRRNPKTALNTMTARTAPMMIMIVADFLEGLAIPDLDLWTGHNQRLAFCGIGIVFKIFDKHLCQFSGCLVIFFFIFPGVSRVKRSIDTGY